MPAHNHHISCSTREQTITSLEHILKNRSSSCNLFTPGPCLISNIPSNIDKNSIILGIDEAGRGPVLGPMIYALSYWSANTEPFLPSSLTDSKQLTPVIRDNIYNDLIKNDNIGYVIRILHASEISRNMQRKNPYNLNAMSMDSSMEMIQCVLDVGLKIEACYIDTVGLPQTYTHILEKRFNSNNRIIKFIVEKKADGKYASCSAASIFAKVTRDRILENWKWSEVKYQNHMELGSGYPSDPMTKEWMKDLKDDLFGYPDLVRFSWETTKLALKKGMEVKWKAEKEEERGQSSMSIFLDRRKIKRKNEMRERLGWYHTRKMRAVMKIV